MTTKNTMTTKITTPASPDPLAGLPVATPKASKAPAATPPTGGVIVNLAQHKKKRLTGQAYKDARDFARKATGYDSTSPIWGKRLPVVLTEIESILRQAAIDLDAADYLVALAQIEEATRLNKELQKRVATGQLINAQS